MSTGIIAIIIIAIILIFWLIAAYNKLIRLRNQVKNAWAQIDVQLQRRYDLIPNLVESVKEYMSYEKGTLEAVTKARTEAMAAKEAIKQEGAPSAGPLGDLVAAEGVLKGALGNIFALAENYPQLRASENMQQLQEELTSTENKVAFSRQAYNDSVMVYNTSQEKFPTNLVASMFGHSLSAMWLTQGQAREAVKVKF